MIVEKHTVKMTKDVERRVTPDGKVMNEYLRKNKLGEGPYSKIKLMKNLKNNQYFAMKKYNLFVLKKKIKMSRNEDGQTKYSTVVDEVRRQVGVWKTLHHDRIACLHEIIEDEEQEKLYLFMDYCQHGDIAGWNSKKQIFTHSWKIDDLKQFFIQAAQGLAYLHSQNVIHRDIKPQNILINSKKQVKIIDFGRSVKLSKEDEKLSGSEGTYHFMAPQMLSEKIEGGYNGRLCDIWALGVSFYCILFGKLPFNHELLIELFKQIQQGKYTLPDPLKVEHEQFVPLLAKMMSLNPDQRPIAQELVKLLQQLN